MGDPLGTTHTADPVTRDDFESQAASAIDQKFADLSGAPGVPGGIAAPLRPPELEFGPHRTAHRRYVHGAIYWQPDVGAFWVHGPIFTKYDELGGEASTLSYPISDQIDLGDGRGKVSHFRHGDIYFSPDGGACALSGKVLEEWTRLGAEQSYLGYPLTDSGPKGAHFERGDIRIADEGTVYNVADTIVLRSGQFDETDDVTGWVEWLLSSEGNFTFSGHLHNSGFLSRHYKVTCVIPLMDSVIATERDGRLGGAAAGDPRDEDWADAGKNDAIREKWDEIINSQTLKSKLEVSETAGDVWEPFGKVLAEFGVAAAAIGAAVWAKNDPNMEEDPPCVWTDGEGNEHRDGGWHRKGTSPPQCPPPGSF